MTEIVDEVLKNKQLSEKNIEALSLFDTYNKAKGNKESTRYNQTCVLARFALRVNKDFKQMTRKDIETYLAEQNLGKYTLMIEKTTIRRFFKWLYNTKDFPEIVSWITISNNCYQVKKKSEMLTEEEVQRMINACDNVRDKCTISVFYDTAIRVGELVNLSIGDVVCDGTNLSISVDGKTGVRNLGLLSSGPLVMQWLNLHPEKNNMNAPLFPSRSPSNFGDRVSESSVLQRVQVIAERAEIKKKVTPHIFRHSKLTELGKRGMNESQMRRFSGWSGDSNMPRVYIHLDDKDVTDTRRLLETGEKPKQVEVQKSNLLPITCQRCGKQNDSNNNYCSSCWFPLTRESVDRDIKILNTFRSKFTKMAIDVDAFVNEYYNFRTVTEEYLQFHDAFNGSKSVSIESLREKLNWNKSRFENFVNGLVECEVLKVENGNVWITKHDGKSVFDNFLMFSKML